MSQNDSWLQTSIEYDNIVEIHCSITPSPGGILVALMFCNTTSTATSPYTIEVWYPITGHISFASESQDGGEIPIGQLYQGIGTSKSIRFDPKIDPNNCTDWMYFYCAVEPTIAEAMLRNAEKRGVVNLNVYIHHSMLWFIRTLNQKTYNFNSVFKFQIPKFKMEEWMTKWTSFYVTLEDLPKDTPKKVIEDFREAELSFNVRAYKASAAMSRRALQQALEDRGATKGSKLMDQIDELKQRNLIDNYTASLAHGIRQFGNFGSHPKDDLLSEINQEYAKLALEVVKIIIKELYGQPKT
jgi:hypothetical protein